MGEAANLVELWRGGQLESVHAGHAVVMNSRGEIVKSWGNPDHVTFPRSSAKILQALPMVESGVADRMGLSTAPVGAVLRVAFWRGDPHGSGWFVAFGSGVFGR